MSGSNPIRAPREARKTDYCSAPDAITAALQKMQKRCHPSLWVKGDSRPFKPVVANTVYGDGRALFFFGTCMDRPYWWLVRGDTSWSTFDDRAEGSVEFAEVCDEIMYDLELEFDKKWEDWDGRERKRPLAYPAINCDGGCHWGRENWPDLPGVSFEPHPLNARFRILSETHAVSGRRQL